MQHQGPDDDVDSGDVEGDGGKNSANIFTFPSSSPSTSAAYASPRHNCMQEVPRVCMAVCAKIVPACKGSFEISRNMFCASFDFC